MCGFVGVLDFENVIDRNCANSALNSLAHRGPDAQNNLFLSDHIYLGHVRLSIIDLSTPANQPLFSSHANVAIVYNGEIYNYLQLKEKLVFKEFKTHSDTEVILEGYLEEGVGFFKKLRGIYAFAIMDMRHGSEIIMARDPSGVKPLYYYTSANSNRIVFASEIKAIKPFCAKSLEVDEPALKQYLNLGFIPEPQTAFRHIKALHPGHFMVWNPGQPVNSKPFFEFKYDNINSLGKNQNYEIAADRLRTAVGRNLVADVEVSVALSGGIDSSLIYYFGTRENPMLRSLTVAFDGDSNYDESDMSQNFAKLAGGLHELIHLDAKLDLEQINGIFDHFDQPFGDSSAIPVYFLNKAARNYGKVLIGGDGGDELFNGYPSQTWLAYLYSWSQHKWLKQGLNIAAKYLPGSYGRKLSRMGSLINSADDPLVMLYNRNSWLPPSTTFGGKSIFRYDLNIPIQDYCNLFATEIPESFEGKIVFDYFRKTMLSDYLRKTDMMSMINGVEWRVPMLDEDLALHAFSIPFKQKSDLMESKKILRRLHRSIYPAYSSSAPKAGFSIPLDTYLSENIKRQIGESITKKSSIVMEWIDSGYVSFLLSEFNNYRDSAQISRAAVYQRVLMLYNLQRWNDIK